MYVSTNIKRFFATDASTGGLHVCSIFPDRGLSLVVLSLQSISVTVQTLVK